MCADYQTEEAVAACGRENLPDRPLEYILELDETFSNKEGLTVAVEESTRTRRPLKTTLIQMGILSEDEILDRISRCLDIPRIRVEDLHPSEAAIRSLGVDFVCHHKICPVDMEDGVLKVAVTDPFDFDMIDELRNVCDLGIQLVMLSSAEMERAIRQHYGMGADTVDSLLKNRETAPEDTSSQSAADVEKGSDVQDASVIKLVDLIIFEAIRNRATDIHIEPFEEELRVRQRIDGILQDMAIPSSAYRLRASIVARVKVMARLDTSEKRLPQDGRIQVNVGRDEYDLRVSILPTAYGEAVNMRILTRANSLLEMEDLGLGRRDLRIVRALTKAAHGIILVTGPTGSGKTTFLYAALSTINSVDRKIITIEDPIEYRMRGVLQMQVVADIGFTFGRALRSILRHDPDVILVGEIRDAETAQTAIRTALTGHLVFSTLHTNDAASAMTRLMDMGVEPFLCSSSIIGVVAERLVRVLCPRCKEPDHVSVADAEVLARRPVSPEETANVFKAKGCSHCRYTGYSGRRGIFETMTISEHIREAIMERTPAHVIRKQAEKESMRLLSVDGWGKIAAGVTSLDEVMRVTQEMTVETNGEEDRA